MTPLGPKGGRLARLERKRFLDALTIAAVAAMFFAAGVPWFLQLLDVDIAAAAWSAFISSAIYLALALVIDRWGSHRVITGAMFVSPFAAVAMSALVWHFAGGIRNPVLLVLFSVPLLGTALLSSRRAVIAVAVFASFVVGWTAAMESPGLGWYLHRLGFPVDTLLRRVPLLSADEQLLETVPAQLFAVVVCFTFSMLAMAVFINRAARFLRLDIERRTNSLEESDGVMVEHAWRAGPIPVAVLTDETAQLVDASESFFNQMLIRTGSHKGSELFDLLEFEDRASIERLLTSGGALQFVRYRIGEESRVASIHAEKFVHHEASYCALAIRDWSDVAYLALAADTIDRPLILVGEEDQRLRYANRAAADALEDEMYFGRDMRWLTESSSGDPRFEVTRTPLRLADSEPVVLLSLSSRADSSRGPSS